MVLIELAREAFLSMREGSPHNALHLPSICSDLVYALRNVVTGYMKVEPKKDGRNVRR